MKNRTASYIYLATGILSFVYYVVLKCANFSFVPSFAECWLVLSAILIVAFVFVHKRSAEKKYCFLEPCKKWNRNFVKIALSICILIACDKKVVRGERIVPMISSTASKDKNGVVHISISNVSLNESEDIQINLGGLKANKVKGEILTSKNISDYNDFDKKDVVTPKSFNGAKIVKGNLNVSLPAKSIVTLTLE